MAVFWMCYGIVPFLVYTLRAPIVERLDAPCRGANLYGSMHLVVGATVLTLTAFLIRRVDDGFNIVVCDIIHPFSLTAATTSHSFVGSIRLK